MKLILKGPKLISILPNFFALVYASFSGGFTVKLGYFIVNSIFICFIHISFTARIRNRAKLNFGMIGE